LRERLAEKDERLREKDTTIEDLRGERDRLLKIVEEHAGTVKLLTDRRAEKEQRKRRSWRLWGGS
jgi:chromosome segregation ATPase